MMATMKALLRMLRRWLRPGKSDKGAAKEGVESKLEEEHRSTTALPDSASIVSDILRQIDVAGTEDGKRTRRKPDKDEWTVYQADFVYAYHFMMSLPHVSHDRLKNKVRAGIISFSLQLSDGGTLELTDYSRRIGVHGVLSVINGRRLLVKVVFVKGNREEQV